MEIDNITLEDLSIFNRIEEQSVFHLFDFTRTIGGRIELRRLFQQPLPSRDRIAATQEMIRYIVMHLDQWPMDITNGTLMVMDKFYETGSEPIPSVQGGFSTLNNLFYRIINSGDYSLIRYSISHFIIFLRTFHQLTEQFNTREVPDLLNQLLDRARKILSREMIVQLIQTDPKERLSFQKVLYFGHALKYRLLHSVLELMELYYQLDARYSMAMTIKEFSFSFPEFYKESIPRLEIEGLYHPLLKEPVAYDVSLNKETNFLFLTGANMSGKSTFIKAIGVSVFLAHLGMGVPAGKMKLSFFEGILSNIQVQDNLFKGESYFYNEVQRVKKTISKINDGRQWLILIDELFKGTNFQDAKTCSVIVIEGFLKMKESLFILSTHLYEIAEELKKHPNISFRYFETFVKEEIPSYSYQIKEGISNDRLGYLIMKREKVLDLLQEIKDNQKEEKK